MDGMKGMPWHHNTDVEFYTQAGISKATAILSHQCIRRKLIGVRHVQMARMCLATCICAGEVTCCLVCSDGTDTGLPSSTLPPGTDGPEKACSTATS